VLVVSRLGNEAGRYQSPEFGTKQELQDFLLEFKEFFETDGRHRIWIGATNNSGLLVYDQHHVIFAYGPIDRFERILENRGFREQPFSFPAPHCHNYHEDNDQHEKTLWTIAIGQFIHLMTMIYMIDIKTSADRIVHAFQASLCYSPNSREYSNSYNLLFVAEEK